MKNIEEIVNEIIARRGRGPWFPKKTGDYRTHIPIKTMTDTQAFSAWITATNNHSNIFNFVDEVNYQNKTYTRNKTIDLYNAIDNDWESIDKGI